MPNDKTFGIFIENGDWKHEHLWLDHLVSDYLNSRGIEFDSFTKQVGTSDSDCYTAWHYFHILGEAEPMFYDVNNNYTLLLNNINDKWEKNNKVVVITTGIEPVISFRL